MTRRGLVLEKGRPESIVLTPDGEFKKVRSLRSVGVGEETEIPRVGRWRPYSLVAAFLIVLVGFTTLQLVGSRPLLAYVTMDINPSLEFGVDSQWRVQSLRGLSTEGELLAGDLAYRGRELPEVIENVLSAYPSRQLVIFTVCAAGDDLLSEALLDEFNAQVTRWQHQEAQVETWEVTPQLRETAQGHGLSVARLTLALAAHEQGTAIDLEEIKWGDMVQTLVHSGVNVGHLVREAASGKRWDLPEEEEKLPAWMREGGPNPPGQDKEPGGPAQPPGRPIQPPGHEKGN